MTATTTTLWHTSDTIEATRLGGPRENARDDELSYELEETQPEGARAGAKKTA